MRLSTALALALAALLAIKLAQLLLLVFAAVLVAILLRAAADPLARLVRIPPHWSLALVILLTGLFAFGLVTAFGTYFASQVQNLIRAVPSAWTSAESRLVGIGVPRRLMGTAAQRLADSGSIGLITSLAAGAMNALAGLLLASVGGVYLAAQPELYRKGLLALIPEPGALRAAAVLDEMAQDLRHWLAGQSVTMVAVGVLTGFGASLIGLPWAAGLGLLAGILEFVPYVGPIATAVPAVLLALSISIDAAWMTLLLLFAVQQVEGYLLTPLIQRWAVSLPPALSLFSVFAMGALFGALGVLLAAPLTVCACILVRRIYIPWASGVHG